MELIRIGRVTRPHGLRGELRIRLDADFFSLPSDFPRLYLQGYRPRPKPFSVLEIRKHQGEFLVLLEGIEGKDGADAWKGADVFVRRRDLPSGDPYLPGGWEIRGFDVSLESGRILGKVENVIHTPAHQVWAVLTSEGKEILFPAVPDFVLRVDRAARLVVVVPPDGLLEIYTS
jgi:16S rRNA processing protein RimM